MASRKPTPAATNKSSSSGKGPPAPSDRQVVPRRRPLEVASGSDAQQEVIVPKGYHQRQLKPADNYDVISFAKAMNEDFGAKVKELFNPETEAAIAAQKTGIYIGWRCPEFKHDCQRVGIKSKCFCGHILAEHDKYSGSSVRVPCKAPGCNCTAFNFSPSRPEDVGEFWLKKRRDFDAGAWRMKCRCKHTHEEHDATGMHKCKSRGCGCSIFSSSSVCAACDHHWEKHQTFFETANDRSKNGLPVGEDYIPFAEIESLKSMVLTGEDIERSPFHALEDGPKPVRKAITGNDAPVTGYGQTKSGFKPTYD